MNRAKASLKEFRHQVNFNESMLWRRPPAMPAMSFTVKYAEHVVYPHDNPLVVTLKISNCLVHGIVLDGGSSANISYVSTIEKLMIGHGASEAYPIPSNRVHRGICDPRGPSERPGPNWG